ncbi:MAG: hypothetical protein U5O69_07740 [Candidatus Competibacteraceae bacterium]|nr:hypothetical protein [Candidatus Competibacteraceae bacterium]
MRRIELEANNDPAANRMFIADERISAPERALVVRDPIKAI